MKTARPIVNGQACQSIAVVLALMEPPLTTPSEPLPASQRAFGAGILSGEQESLLCERIDTGSSETISYYELEFKALYDLAEKCLVAAKR